MPEAAAPIRPLVAGNWKMNGLKASIGQALKVKDALAAADAVSGVDVLICPPATLVMVLAEVLKGSPLLVGGQDVHPLASGAHTGDISAEMLADAGAVAAIVGHSERRTNHGELDRIVRAKAEAALRAGIAAIVCVGETEGERKARLTLEVVTRQLAASVPKGATANTVAIAYEPVWAIGTGLTPTVADVAETHAAIRAALIEKHGAEGANMRILYGGSVKPSNARELLSVANVNGALVGGASLKAADFLAIAAGC